MTFRHRLIASLFALSFLLFTTATLVSAGSAEPQSWAVQALTPIPLAGEFNGDLRTIPYSIPAVKQEMREPGEPEPRPEKLALQPLESPTTVFAPAPNMPSPSQSFAGMNFLANGAGWPPDTVGDVGPNHFIQAVNTSIAIYNKTGAQLAVFTFDTLWTGQGSTCDGNNMGDPTVVYDPIGNRFIVGDFAWSDFVNGPYFECIAVSKTSDPVSGGWWLYAVRADDNAHPFLPDYPKMGVWLDGLYMGTNMFNIPANTYAGARAYAFNLSDLESGSALRSRVVDVGPSEFTLIPSNFRGAAPPAGRENFFVGESQTGFAWDVYKFHVDYIGGGSTFTGPTTVSQASYTLATSTVPTPANAVDSLADRMMMQLQYRNIGGTESLWANHTVRTGPSSAPNGIQWAQINVTGGTINTTPVQEQIFGNLSGDGLHRWMGSLAVDKTGNMAIGYSAANSSHNPSIRYAGRLASDSLNQLAQGEAILLTGGGSQSGNCGPGVCRRWGDYSGMSVDPVDDCTFWYTTEYFISNGLNWQTQIGTFKFGLGITPAKLPVASNGTAYNQALSTTGGTGPFTFTLSSGSLPIGLTLSSGGVISGTPNDTNGVFNFTVHVVDTAHPTDCTGTGDQSYSLRLGCLFCDDFEDGVQPTWLIVKPTWLETGGEYRGTAVRKAETLATPVFAGCATCTVEADMKTAGGTGNRVWLLAWFLDKDNYIELMMKQETGRWILKQHSGGSVVTKAKGLATILPNQNYHAVVDFNGSVFTVSIDGVVLITMPKGAATSPSGSVGFQVKATTGSYGSILVY